MKTRLLNGGRHMRNKKIIIGIVAAIIAVSCGIVLFFVFRKVEYPILKTKKIGGETYTREIYPGLEVRYPVIDVNSDSMELIIQSDLKSSTSSYDNDADNMRRTVTRVYYMPALYADENIEKLSYRAANASVIITNDKRISLKNEKDKDTGKKQYTGKWVDVYPNEQDNVKIYILSSVPIEKNVIGEYQTTVANAEEAKIVENINKCVIEVNITYKDGHKERQLLKVESQSDYNSWRVRIYRIKDK